MIEVLNVGGELSQSKRNTNENSETSESSVKNAGEKRVKSIKMISKRQIEQLNDRVKVELQKNRRYYDKLTVMNPYFSMKLYVPDNHFTLDQYNTESVDLMVKQLELLLDDGHTLEKEILKAQLRKMPGNSKESHQFQQWKQHYACLRKVWLNGNEQQANRALDIVQQLNKKVFIIKNSIHTMIDFEKKCHQTKSEHDHYHKVAGRIEEVVQSMGEYESLRQKYENSRMCFQEMQQKFNQYVVKMEEKMWEKNELLERIRRQNEELKRTTKQSKQKLIASEVRETNLRMRIKQLQSDQKQKKAEKSLLLSSLSQGTLKSSELLNFQRIRFTKMESKETLLRTQEEKQRNSHKLNLTVDVNQSNNDEEEPVVKPFSINGNIDQSVNGSSKEPENNISLATARSNQGKKGRFMRMRSPGHGKLLKIQGQQMQSQKLIANVSPRWKQVRSGINL